ncbi:hypothetical protein Skr01_64860 [Sphaerisporangium krabiense]|uniref:Uncharacterized protein n=1 Tax=Sphaerisporangium krabiense TaxID=763782 RepID=A0A7W8YZW9_9ACTN|nr:hypothetical protein [Sphaerisporangium krabiense]MBB5624897.1 hypothetical protein [Sphaerisporangium krabiense]GII66401.1 hypothetical protein Skr01_64860 [Sphaerisporangium krabiense]
MVHRYRHQLIAVGSLAAGALATWILAATGTDGYFFRSLLYPWTFAAVLIAGVVLGVFVPVKTAVAALVPFTAPQPVLAVWQGVSPRTTDTPGLWAVGFAASSVLLVFAVGCIAIGVCVRLMFRR